MNLLGRPSRRGRTFALGLALLALIAAPGLPGCTPYAEETPFYQPSATSEVVFHIPLYIEDAGRRTATDPSTPLYETRKHQPVVDPDGRPVTLEAFEAARGRVAVACVDGGVSVKLSMEGLLPGGVYSIWLTTFGPRGFDPAAPDLNRTGLGALGARDGSESFFTASATGTGAIEATTPTGALSTFGQLSACPLAGEDEWHVVGAYHIDGQTHGPEPGPLGTFVEQFAFIFEQP